MKRDRVVSSESNDWKAILEKGVYNSEAAKELLASDSQEKRLTNEQQQIIEAAMSGKNIFFTGSAGVGKSFTLNHLIQELTKKYGQESVFVTASTGIAATHIGGTTLHSFAGTGISTDIKEVMKKVRRKSGRIFPTVERWMQCRVLVIDEVSMISPEFFTILDQVGRRVRKNMKVPFGGIQLIVTGDFMQLPAVRKNGGEEKDQAPLLFECKSWKETIHLSILLTTVHRQKNPEFIKLLQHVRLATVTDEDDALLRSRIHAKLEENGILPTRVYTHNANVNDENQMELNRLPGSVVAYASIDEGSDKYAVETLTKNCLAPQRLELKLDAQVMLLKNLAPPLLVNGSRGKVIGFEFVDAGMGQGKRNCPRVQFENGMIQTIGFDEWTTTKGYQVIARRRQIPLCLAWAITVHKCQGMTFDKMQVNIASCWDPGQAYVALSRCTSLEGLSILGYNRYKIKSNPKVLEFYSRLGDKEAKDVLKEKEEEEEEEKEKKKRRVTDEDKSMWWNGYV